MVNSEPEVLWADSWRKYDTGREFLEAGAARYGVGKSGDEIKMGWSGPLEL